MKVKDSYDYMQQGFNQVYPPALGNAKENVCECGEEIIITIEGDDRCLDCYIQEEMV